MKDVTLYFWDGTLRCKTWRYIFDTVRYVVRRYRHVARCYTMLWHTRKVLIRTLKTIFIFRVTGVGMGFLHKLHIIYLINDVLHHSTRKSTQDVRPVFEEVIVPIYCCTFVGESSEHQQRLEKVIRIWETNSYFDIETIKVRLFFYWICIIACSNTYFDLHNYVIVAKI